jgi:hypothetical protein
LIGILTTSFGEAITMDFNAENSLGGVLLAWFVGNVVGM